MTAIEYGADYQKKTTAKYQKKRLQYSIVMYHFNNSNTFISFFGFLNLQIKKIICQLVMDAIVIRHQDMISAQKNRIFFVFQAFE